MQDQREVRATSRQMVAWAFYDWASNSYAVIVLTFVFAAYFSRRVAEDPNTGTVQWGVTLGVAGFLVAIGAPLLGAIVDQLGRRKPWILLFTFFAVASTSSLWFVRPSTDYVMFGLVLVALSELGSEYGAVLYNAMLPTLVSEDRLGRWSGWAWSLGYAGGLLCLVVALVFFVQGEMPWFDFDRDAAEHVRATFPLAGAWFFVFAMPLFLFTPDIPRSGKTLRQAARDGRRQLLDSLRNIRQYVNIAKFLIARIIYIDGLATVFAFGGVYAAGTFEMDEQQVLLFGIALNVAAGIGAASFAWIDDWIGGKRTIVLSLVGLIVPGVAILLVESTALFWMFGIIVGIFVGPVQAASRSFLARLAPPEMRNQMFGLYALSGKVAFFCPLLVGGLTWLTDSQRVGMSAIVLFFAGGLTIMLTVESPGKSNRIDAK